MHPTTHRTRTLQITAVLFPLVTIAASARADIFQWEYTNPADPSQGKRQSTTLARGGAGVDAVPGANLIDRNLTMAYLIGADVRDADFLRAQLNDADFTGAQIQGANFSRFSLTGPQGSGIALAQLYSTASYEAHDLSRINFSFNYLAGGNFANQNLTNVSFFVTSLTGASFRDAVLDNADLTLANLTGAEVRGARFYNTTSEGITAAQLYSTASYQAHDLTGIHLGTNDLSGWNFAGQNLTNAVLNAPLTGADFADAEVRGASLLGITFAQLYSTASYQAHDLTGIKLGRDLAGGNFAGQNLTNARFSGATLTDANFTGADVKGASFDIDITSPPGCPGGCFPIYHGTGIALAQLYSTASYQAKDLSGINLSRNSLTGANFAGQNLSNASFSVATLTGADFRNANLTNAYLGFSLTDADFTDADVRGASFISGENGLTLSQLYSTASYQTGDLTGIVLQSFNLPGANFAGQKLANADLRGANLTGANFRNASLVNGSFIRLDIGCFNGTCGIYYIPALLTGADLTAADARGSQLLILTPVQDVSGGPRLVGADAIVTNLIRSDGHIDGLDLDNGGLLIVRDYHGDSRYEPDGPAIAITVDQHLAMSDGGKLRMVFEAETWGSTISFAPGIPVSLGGTLELSFAADVNLSSQLSRTLKVFDWTGVTPTGAFAVSSPYQWDLSHLYTTGEVTLTAVPEPRSSILFGVALTALIAMVQVRLTISSVRGENK